MWSSERDRQKYYELAYKKLVGEIDQTWNQMIAIVLLKKQHLL